MFAGCTFYISELGRDEEIRLKDKITSLHGEVINNLIENLSYFVCLNVKVPKYNTAKRLNIKIILPSFIDHCYLYGKVKSELLVRGAQGLNISTTGFRGDELNLIMNDISQLNGIFELEMNDKTDLLIFKVGKVSQKTKAAKQWGLRMEPKSYLRGWVHLIRIVNN
jgi:hypothetical protein